MTSKAVDHIAAIQDAHPWLLEKEARHLLVGAYAALTNHFGYRGDELRESMVSFVENVCLDDRSKIEQLLRDTGGLTD